jgi:hypothetical protein
VSRGLSATPPPDLRYHLPRATLLIEAGRTIPAADMAAADRALSLGDPRLAERLARPAWEQEGSFVAALALAQSLIDQVLSDR